jgi:hypothetical protein
VVVVLLGVDGSILLLLREASENTKTSLLLLEKRVEKKG